MVSHPSWRRYGALQPLQSLTQQWIVRIVFQRHHCTKRVLNYDNNWIESWFSIVSYEHRQNLLWQNNSVSVSLSLMLIVCHRPKVCQPKVPRDDLRWYWRGFWIRIMFAWTTINFKRQTAVSTKDCLTSDDKMTIQLSVQDLW